MQNLLNKLALTQNGLPGTAHLDVGPDPSCLPVESPRFDKMPVEELKAEGLSSEAISLILQRTVISVSLRELLESHSRPIQDYGKTLLRAYYPAFRIHYPDVESEGLLESQYLDYLSRFDEQFREIEVFVRPEWNNSQASLEILGGYHTRLIDVDDFFVSIGDQLWVGEKYRSYHLGSRIYDTVMKKRSELDIDGKRCPIHVGEVRDIFLMSEEEAAEEFLVGNDPLRRIKFYASHNRMQFDALWPYPAESSSSDQLPILSWALAVQILDPDFEGISYQNYEKLYKRSLGRLHPDLEEEEAFRILREYHGAEEIIPLIELMKEGKPEDALSRVCPRSFVMPDLHVWESLTKDA